MINWIATSASSNIRAFKYENTILSIRFKTGSIYEYYDVPSEIIESMRDTNSIGRFLNKTIKPYYECKKII